MGHLQHTHSTGIHCTHQHTCTTTHPTHRHACTLHTCTLHTCTPARMHTTHMHTSTHAHIHTCTPAHMHTYTHAHQHTCTLHTCTPTHMHTSTHAHYTHAHQHTLYTSTHAHYTYTHQHTLYTSTHAHYTHAHQHTCTLHTCTPAHMHTTHMHTSTHAHYTHAQQHTLYTIHGTYIHIIKDVVGAWCTLILLPHPGPAHCTLLYSSDCLALATPVHIRSPSHTSAPYAAHVTCTAQPAATTAVPRVRIQQTPPDVGIYNSLRISAQSIPKKPSPDLWGDEAAPPPE